MCLYCLCLILSAFLGSLQNRDWKSYDLTMKEVRLLRELLDPPNTALAEKVETVTTPVSHPEQDAPARKETTAVKGEVPRTQTCRFLFARFHYNMANRK